MWLTSFAIALTLAAPSTEEAALQARAKELVAKLGDPAFRVREKATAELLTIGYPARAAVLDGQKSNDIEISERCKKLYPLIWQRDLEKRLEQFLAAKMGVDPEGIPAAKRWFKLVGDSKESREMYVALVKQHVDELLRIELHPELAKQQYFEFAKNNYTKAVATGGGISTRQPPAETDILLFFFLGSVSDVRPTTVPVGTSSLHYTPFLTNPIVTQKLANNEAMQKLFTGWLANERYSITLRRGLDMIGTYKIRSAVPMLTKIAKDPTAVVTTRSAAILSFAKLGTKEDIKELEQLATDKTVLATVSFAVNGKIEQGTVQIRDLALGAMLQLLGQNASDFGFERKPPAGLVTTSYTYYAFSTDEKREAAHKKWADWAKANLKK